MAHALDPAVFREKLVKAALFIAAYEVLKDLVVGRVKSFYVPQLIGLGASQLEELERQYRQEVLALDKQSRALPASLSWLKQNGALEASDLDDFAKTREARDETAHRLPDALFGEFATDLTKEFGVIVRLSDKIGKWWAIHVEIPLGSVEGTEEIDADEVQPGTSILLHLMQNLATGNAEWLDGWLAKEAQSDA